MSGIAHIPGVTFHARHGEIRNAFSYGVDYVLLDPEEPGRLPALFSRDAPNVMSLRDRDHGGPPGNGTGAAWLRGVLDREGLGHLAARIRLMAQPRVLGHIFNPVSFWLVEDEARALRVVVAEVSNTFGDRHSYLCHREDLGAIGPDDLIHAQKVFHVSPFQDVDGAYAFRFHVTDDAVDIRIDCRTDDGQGVLATLRGRPRPLTNRAILRACLGRPLGSRRVLGLIHWQALKLWWKGARYRPRPLPPDREVSR